MKIRVYNNESFIFEGRTGEFLKDNDNDPDLIEALKDLTFKNIVTFQAISGEWVFERIPESKDIKITRRVLNG